jgi:hypothetical protein
MIQALRHYTLVGFARVEVNGRKGILIAIKIGSGQGAKQDQDKVIPCPAFFSS